MEGLTKKQEEIYIYIGKFIKKHNYPPTIREICDGVGLRSTSSVANHLKNMKAKGLIEYEIDSPRTLRLIKDVDAEIEEYKSEYGNEPSLKTVRIPLWMETYAYDQKWDLSELLKEAIWKKINE